MANLFKILGVGALIGGAAVALYQLNKQQTAKKAAQNPQEETAGDTAGETNAVHACEEQPEETAEPKKKPARKSRPAKLSAEDWLAKGQLLAADEEEPQHLLKAAECFRNAAKMGNYEAACVLAEMYAEGLGVMQDYESCFTLYRDAAEGGYEPSWAMLAECYESGKGTEVNPLDAFYWYAMAAASGDESAKDVLGELADVTADETDFPVELVREWYEKRHPDLSEEEKNDMDAMWNGLELDYLPLDTDMFWDDDLLDDDQEEVDDAEESGIFDIPITTPQEDEEASSIPAAEDNEDCLGDCSGCKGCDTVMEDTAEEEPPISYPADEDVPQDADLTAMEDTAKEAFEAANSEEQC